MGSEAAGKTYTKNFSPDFSDSGKRRAKKSWIRPQNTVFWDLDSLRNRSKHIRNG